MNHGIDAIYSYVELIGISDASPYNPYAQFLKIITGTALIRCYLIITREQLAANSTAEKSATTRYQDFHLSFSVAHAASFSRPILAL
jgi:hypothetical protein